MVGKDPSGGRSLSLVDVRPFLPSSSRVTSAEVLPWKGGNYFSVLIPDHLDESEHSLTQTVSFSVDVCTI